jgi:hypothetical protein
MTKQEVIDLMEGSANKYVWNKNCDLVKAKFNDEYPEFWWWIVRQGI